MPETTPPAVPIDLNGVMIHRGYLAPAQQRDIVAAVRGLCIAAPLRQPVVASGRKMSVRMTSAGRIGWVADRRGYRYEARDPDGRPWPAIPASILGIWTALSGTSRRPDSCLVNFYGEGARMGLHRDEDEGDFTAPVVSVSLGDDAMFRVGGLERKGPTRSLWLASGDVAVMGGAARLAYHGVDRIRFGSSALLPQGGRLNLTLRVVDQPPLSAQQPA